MTTQDKLAHLWYADNGSIFKCLYCTDHKPEIDNQTEYTFKTKNALLAHLTTQKLLNETDEPPF